MKKTGAKPLADSSALKIRSPRTGTFQPNISPVRKSGKQALNGETSRRTRRETAVHADGQRARRTKPRPTTPVLLEQRVAALELELQQLKATLATSQPQTTLPWWDRLTGTFANDPLFDEMVAAGQAYRRAQNARSRA